MRKKKKMEIKSELLGKYYGDMLEYLLKVIRSCNSFDQVDTANIWAHRICRLYCDFEQRKYSNTPYLCGYVRSLFTGMEQRCTAEAIETIHKIGENY